MPERNGRGMLVLYAGRAAMKPSYSEKGIEIYNADCREVLPELGIYDLCLTDPPYGIGTWHNTGGNSITKEQARDINKWDVAPNEETFKLCLRSCVHAVIWGGNYFGDVLGSCKSPLIWDKGLRGLHLADGEIAWTNFDFGTVRILTFSPNGSDNFGNKYHPTQKPIRLMKWCIGFLPQIKTMLDPFCGSGSTLVAAKQMGKSCVGIEVEEKYVEITANRLRQSVMEF